MNKEIIVHLPDGKTVKDNDVKATIIDLSPFYSGHADQTGLIDPYS